MKKRTLTKKLQRFFFYLVWKLLPTCKEFVPILSESLDGKLSLYKRIIVTMHLVTCPSCVRYLKQIKFLREASHKCGEVVTSKEPDVKLSDAARERLKNALKSAAMVF